MLDRLHTMKVFLAVAEEGSFTAASHRLAMTVSNVTRHVAALEEQLGTRLLQRTTRRVSLTAAGERYVICVQVILESVEAASAVVRSNSAELNGVLRIVAPPSLTDALLAPLITPFRNQYPGLTLDLYVDPQPLPDLNKYDLGFLQVPEGFNANVVARTLITAETILCAAPDYLARHGTPTQPQDLAQHMCLLRRPAGLRRNSIDLWPSGQSVLQPASHEIAVRPAIIINQTMSLLHLTMSGAGIANFTSDAARPHLQSGALQQVLPGWITGRYTVLAALPSRKHLPQRTQAFLEFVTEAAHARAAAPSMGGVH